MEIDQTIVVIDGTSIGSSCGSGDSGMWLLILSFWAVFLGYRYLMYKRSDKNIHPDAGPTS